MSSNLTKVILDFEFFLLPTLNNSKSFKIERTQLSCILRVLHLTHSFCTSHEKIPSSQILQYSNIFEQFHITIDGD